MKLTILLSLSITALASPAGFAQRPRMGGYVNKAFHHIFETNAGRSIEIKEIVDLATDRPGPYRLVVEFSATKPMLRLTIFKNDRQIERQLVKPFAGEHFNQKWTSYVLEADGLRFEVGINGAGSMPVNVYQGKSNHQAIMRGIARLEGGPASTCGEERPFTR